MVVTNRHTDSPTNRSRYISSNGPHSRRVLCAMRPNSSTLTEKVNRHTRVRSHTISIHDFRNSILYKKRRMKAQHTETPYVQFKILFYLQSKQVKPRAFLQIWYAKQQPTVCYGITTSSALEWNKYAYVYKRQMQCTTYNIGSQWCWPIDTEKLWWSVGTPSPKTVTPGPQAGQSS